MSPASPLPPSPPGGGEVLLEFVRSGMYLKCTAIDPVSGLEAVAMGPARDPEGVRRLAIIKLKQKTGR